MTLDLVLILVLVAIVVVAFEMAQSYGPQYRTGCQECAAAKRRKAEEDEALAHDYEHKGHGFKAGAPDRYWCRDEACKRNPKGVE
jgi:hypothetical protein